MFFLFSDKVTNNYLKMGEKKEKAKKRPKLPKTSFSNVFQVHAAPESWSKYRTEKEGQQISKFVSRNLK